MYHNLASYGCNRFPTENSVTEKIILLSEYVVASPVLRSQPESATKVHLMHCPDIILSSLSCECWQKLSSWPMMRDSWSWPPLTNIILWFGQKPEYYRKNGRKALLEYVQHRIVRTRGSFPGAKILSRISNKSASYALSWHNIINITLTWVLIKNCWPTMSDGWGWPPLHDLTNTVGRVLIAWFNDCALGKSGQIANPIIVIVNPIPCYSIRARLCLRIY